MGPGFGPGLDNFFVGHPVVHVEAPQDYWKVNQ